MNLQYRLRSVVRDDIHDVDGFASIPRFYQSNQVAFPLDDILQWYRRLLYIFKSMVWDPNRNI